MIQTELKHREQEMLENPLAELMPGGLSGVNTMTLQIGDVCCAFYCRDDVIIKRLRQLYGAFLTEQPPDITVELEATDRLSAKDLSKAVYKTKYVHKEDNKGNRFRTTSKIMTGEYDLTHRFIRITGERSLGDPDSELNHLNRLMSLAYYSACKVKYNDDYPAMLVHACGILRHGQALLFTGPSDAGKTTIARLCGEQNGEVINDEILLVSRPDPRDGSIIVRSAPILGAFPPHHVIEAPLHSISLIKQSDRTSVRRLDRTDAYLRLMRQVITPAYIGQMDKRAILSLITEFSDEVTASIPVFELEFTLKKDSLWQTVGELERISGGKELL